MKAREIFKENLKYHRKQRGLTQEKLAEAINCNPKYISEIESRNKFPSPETIDAVASALNITITQLFEEQGSPMNAAAFNKTKFAEELTTELHNRMKQDILDFLDKKIK